MNFCEALISFARSTYMINENIGTLQVEVTISEPFNVDITVHIVTGDILATGISYTLNITIPYVFIILYPHLLGGDYGCNQCNRTLVAGMRNVFFPISVNDDNILELDEDFMLSNISTFIPSSSSIRVITGSPENTVVLIVDNDCELYEYTLIKL